MPLDGRGPSGWGGKDLEWGASGAATVLNKDVMTAGTGCWLGGEIQVVRLCVRSGDGDSIKMHFFGCCCYFIFWPRGKACGILVPQPGMECSPPAVDTQSLNRLTVSEVPCVLISTKHF